MKKLTILRDYRSPISANDLMRFEDKYALKFPDSLANLIMQYEGCTVAEHVYHNPNLQGFFPVYQFLYLWKAKERASIEAIYEGHLEDAQPKLIPFAIDSGGWDYSVSIDDTNYKSVWVNQWDSGDSQPYLCIANSLEEFVTGLVTLEEALKLGY